MIEYHKIIYIKKCRFFTKQASFFSRGYTVVYFYKMFLFPNIYVLARLNNHHFLHNCIKFTHSLECIMPIYHTFLIKNKNFITIYFTYIQLFMYISDFFKIKKLQIVLYINKKYLPLHPLLEISATQSKD